jgi:hypothetical protein
MVALTVEMKDGKRAALMAEMRVVLLVEMKVVL